MFAAGEEGEPVALSQGEKGEADRSVRAYGFNMVVSDKISMTRTIPDTRLDEYVQSCGPVSMSQLQNCNCFHCKQLIAWCKLTSGCVFINHDILCGLILVCINLTSPLHCPVYVSHTCS